MSILVYRDGIIAADRRVSYGDLVPAWTTMKKIVRFDGDGSIGGSIGSPALVERFRVAFQVGMPDSFNVPDGADWIGLIVEPNGKIICRDALGAHNVSPPYVAIGSGAVAAYGALFMGASAERAVAAACAIDPACGGGIDQFSLETDLAAD